jgi:hypothetical protein
MNDRNRKEIPSNQLLIIAWGGIRTLSAPRRGDQGKAICPGPAAVGPSSPRM